MLGLLLLGSAGLLLLGDVGFGGWVFVWVLGGGLLGFAFFRVYWLLGLWL